MLNANQNGQPQWKQMTESECMVVIHPVRHTNEDIQSGRWMLDLLAWSLTVCQGEREAAAIEGKCSSWIFCLFRHFPASETRFRDGALETCTRTFQPLLPGSSLLHPHLLPFIFPQLYLLSSRPLLLQPSLPLPSIYINQILYYNNNISIRYSQS